MSLRPADIGSRLSIGLSILVCLLGLACSSAKSTPTPAVSAVATAVASDTAVPPTATVVPTLPAPAPMSWSACGGFQCTTFEVPLDYTHPAQASIQLAVVRQPAKDPANRIGSLLVNNGGPGGDAVEFVKAIAPTLPRDIQDHFDIVAFDPRGVGQSTPLVCHDNIQKLIALEPYPTSDDQWKQIDDETKQFADLCAQRGANLLPFLGTTDVARDMDRVRQALGDDKLTYLGYSYGTSIGQVYADMFPDKVRAIVLDGVLDLSLPADQFTLDQTLAFEAAYGRFLANCRTTQCLGASRGDPDTAINALIKRADASPIAAPGADRPAGSGEVVTAIIGSLYARSQWTGLATALSQAIDGDGSRIIRLTDSFLQRNSDGSYPNGVEMLNAVDCLDESFSRDQKHYETLAAQFQPLAPHFGLVMAQGGIMCSYWGTPPKPLQTPRAHGAPPILVIGNTGDPATPLKWATAASKELESAVLLTYDGEGHTAYREGSSCVDDIVGTYLINLQPPAAGTKCGSAGITPVPPVDAPPAVGLGTPVPSSGTPAPSPTR